MSENPYRRAYDVDILIRGWNNLEQTLACIGSINNSKTSVAYQITYVDNGSDWKDTDDVVALAYALRSDTLIRLPFNHGSVRAINIGLSLALFSPAPYILLMDNDTQVPDGDTQWLERFIGYFADPKVGAAGAVTGYVAGPQHATVVPDRVDDTPATEYPLLVSFAMMLRKSAVRQCGYFDERFEPGNCEDYDYTLRLNEAGWKTVIAESVYIHHKGSQTFGKMDFYALLKKNNRKLVEKWGVEKLKALGVEVAGL